MSSATAPVNSPTSAKKETSFFGKLGEFVFGAKDEKAAPAANLELGGVAVPISKNAATAPGSSNNSRRNISGATGASAPPSPAGPIPNVEKGFTGVVAGNSVSVLMPGRGGKRAAQSPRTAHKYRTSRKIRRTHKVRKHIRGRK